VTVTQTLTHLMRWSTRGSKGKHPLILESKVPT
jgi:hypothetical protein